MPNSSRPRLPLPSLFGEYPRPQAASEALERLLRGNQNFVGGRRHPHQSLRRRQHLAGEGPLVVACSDSWEAPEPLFGCGLGDLFVVRTAGHVVGPAALGSIEFGVLHLGLQLVLVLGHSRCGAIAAAIQADQEGTQPGGYLRDLVSIAPCVTLARATGEPDLAEATMQLNVLQTVATIRHAELLPGVSGLEVRGGRYVIATGKVTLLPDPPQGDST